MTPPDPEKLSLSQRRRSAADSEMQSMPWLCTLEPQHQLLARAALHLGEAKSGDDAVRVGKPVTYWFGLIDGLLKMSYETADGRSTQALSPSVVPGITVETLLEAFRWLLNHSISFNRFVMSQLNERVGQFIAARDSDRMTSPGQLKVRVAADFTGLFNPVLYTGASNTSRITQQKLARLVGLSRQRVRQALRGLELSQLVGIEYGGLRVPSAECRIQQRCGKRHL
jgi:CRP/FNR family transcriptional regulator, cyclic AMP receptor protein